MLKPKHISEVIQRHILDFPIGMNFNKDNFCGMCAYASIVTNGVFEDLGKTSVFLVGKDEYFYRAYLHCWVEVGGIGNIDLTLKQFNNNYPLIHIGSKHEYHKKLHIESFPLTSKQFYDKLIDINWNYSQLPEWSYIYDKIQNIKECL
jgi:hypothetical protein